MLPYVHILLSDLKRDFSASYTCFVVEVASLAENFWENTGFFTQPAAGQKFGGFRCQNDATYTHFGFFLRSKWCHIYTFFFCGQNAARYIYTFSSFLVKMLPYIYTHFGFFGDQNAATYTHLCPFFGVKMIPYIHIFVFFLSKCCYIYTFFFFVKMLQHIHICVGFWDQNATIYTHFGVFFGSKCCHIYTFLEFNFFRKNEKKKKTIRTDVESTQRTDARVWWDARRGRPNKDRQYGAKHRQSAHPMRKDARREQG